MSEIKSVSIIGTGNVGWHFAIAFHQAGIEIRHIISREKERAEEICRQVNAVPVSDIDRIREHPDLYLLCVSDDAIAHVSAAFQGKGVRIVHTSGSTGMDVLSEVSGETGVLYPLQTFSRGVDMDYSQVPFLIEGSSGEMKDIIRVIARLLSDKIFDVDSEHRMMVHMAAVFACNFSNHMAVIAADLMKGSGLEFDLLMPLIRQTTGKLEKMDPSAAQTGPAVRNDQQILGRHLKTLEDRPREQEIYRMISENILRYRKDQNE